MKPLTVPSTDLLRLALRLTSTTSLQTDPPLNLCSNCKLFPSPSLRTLAQRHRQNGEILVSDPNTRASVLRRSSSTCATRTLNRQGCKSASGTENPHHESFSDFDAPHRQPVHLYNGSPGLQRQLLTPIREVKTLPTSSHLTDAAQLWNGKFSFTIAAIAAGALVSPCKTTPIPFFPRALFICHIISQASCGGPMRSCVLPVEKRHETCLSSAANLVGIHSIAKAFPLSSPHHLHFPTAFHPIGISRKSIGSDAFPVGKRRQDFPFLHTCGGYLSLQHLFHCLLLNCHS